MLYAQFQRCGTLVQRGGSTVHPSVPQAGGLSKNPQAAKSHRREPRHGLPRSGVVHHGQADRPTAVAAGAAHQDEIVKLKRDDKLATARTRRQ